MTDKKRDSICSVLFLIFGLFLFVESLAIRPMMGKDLGSGFVPKIVAGAIVVTAAVKLILTLAGRRKETAQAVEGKIASENAETAASENPAKKMQQEDKTGGFLTIAALLIYALIFLRVGFILSTILYLFAQITILSDEKNRSLPLFAVISVAASLAIYFIFVYLIKMPLPAGILKF